jgi:hypothetical protein
MGRRAGELSGGVEEFCFVLFFVEGEGRGGGTREEGQEQGEVRILSSWVLCRWTAGGGGGELSFFNSEGSAKTRLRRSCTANKQVSAGARC